MRGFTVDFRCLFHFIKGGNRVSPQNNRDFLKPIVSNSINMSKYRPIPNIPKISGKSIQNNVIEIAPRYVE